MSARDAVAAAAASAPDQGGFTIGLLGRDVPVELVEAAGARPYRLRGEPGRDLAAADRYLGRGLDPAARSLLAGLLETGFRGLDAIVASSDTDATLRLFYLLREFRRVEPDLAVPPVHLVDVLHLPRPTTHRYTVRQLEGLADVLAGWTGSDPRAALAPAVAAHLELRRMLRLIADARRDAATGFRGSDLLLAVLAAGRLPAAEAIPLVEALLAEPAAPRPGAPIVLSGSEHDEPGVTAAIEAAGARIVADDHGGGELGLDRVVTAPTLDALAAAAVANGPTPQRGSAPRRGAHTARLVAASSAAGVLVYARRHDEAPLWDAWAQRRATDVPVEVIRDQDYGEIDADALRTALERIGGTGG